MSIVDGQLLRANQHLWGAVRILDGETFDQFPLTWRLGKAGVHHISALQPDRFPQQFRDRFASIHARLTRDGTFEETTSKLTLAEAKRIAAQVRALYTSVDALWRFTMGRADETPKLA